MRKGKKATVQGRQDARSLPTRTELGLPDTQVLLQGQNCVKVCPCLRLLQYSDTMICARVGQRILHICGKQLHIRVFCAKTLEVWGQIEGVLWKKEGEH